MLKCSGQFPGRDGHESVTVVVSLTSENSSGDARPADRISAVSGRLKLPKRTMLLMVLSVWVIGVMDWWLEMVSD